MTNNMTIVGMADLNVLKAPGILTTLGLGSCVGICLYDPTTKVIGMAHCMLPDSNLIQNNQNIAKFVDTACVRLVNDMARLGAVKAALKAKLVGGAQMFAFTSNSESLRIGDRNVEAAIKVLRSMNIPIIGKETGDKFGRTIELHSEDGRVVIKAIGQPLRSI